MKKRTVPFTEGQTDILYPNIFIVYFYFIASGEITVYLY